MNGIGNEKWIVIVHLNNRYEDVSQVFDVLFKRYWSDCPFNVIYSYSPCVFGKFNNENMYQKAGDLAMTFTK